MNYQEEIDALNKAMCRYFSILLVSENLIFPKDKHDAFLTSPDTISQDSLKTKLTKIGLHIETLNKRMTDVINHLLENSKDKQING